MFDNRLSFAQSKLLRVTVKDPCWDKWMNKQNIHWKVFDIMTAPESETGTQCKKTFVIPELDVKTIMKTNKKWISMINLNLER